MRNYKLNRRFDYPDLHSVTSEDGTRVYHTPAGISPSVTTILATLPHPELDAWRERVGAEEADRISKEATTIGSFMHDTLECYVKGTPLPEPQTELDQMAVKMFHCVKLFGLKDLNEIWGVEESLYCYDLYAGRTDLMGLYKNKPSIIDYKTSKFNKKAEYIENYKLQLAAYKMAHEIMFPEQTFTQGVLLIGIRPNPPFSMSPKIQRVIIEEEEFKAYEAKWLTVLEGYYSTK